MTAQDIKRRLCALLVLEVSPGVYRVTLPTGIKVTVRSVGGRLRNDYSRLNAV